MIIHCKKGDITIIKHSFFHDTYITTENFKGVIHDNTSIMKHKCEGTCVVRSRRRITDKDIKRKILKLLIQDLGGLKE